MRVPQIQEAKVPIATLTEDHKNSDEFERIRENLTSRENAPVLPTVEY
jgi:hypothetical protein